MKRKKKGKDRKLDKDGRDDITTGSTELLSSYRWESGFSNLQIKRRISDNWSFPY